MADRTCEVCKRKFRAKAADVARGWARCCSKACAAMLRERRRRPAQTCGDGEYDPDMHPYSVEALGQDGCSPF